MNRSAILVNRKSGVPLHRQLESALRAAILSGVLSPGERVFSSRELQTHLGLSRNTIVEALDQLHAEGYLVTRRGVGTFVSTHVQQPKPLRTELRRRAIFPSQRARDAVPVQSLAANLTQSAPFRPGLPALDLFPVARFKRGFQTSDWTPELLDYAGPQGHFPLRDAIARRLQQTRGIVCSPDQIFITSGAQAAFSLVCRVLLNPREIAVVEDPGYPNVRAILQAEGIKIFAAPVDAAGIDVASFRKRRAKLAYVTPSHQYPSGAVLSLDRRFALLEWAAAQDAWILEDDYDSEFNYSERPHPALQGLDAGRRVIYAGTFSKVLSPALRVAYLVVPQSLCAAFKAVYQITGGPPDAIVQSALARFMDGGHLGRHIAKMRKVYDERRRFVSAALAKISGAPFHIRDSRAGLHFIAELPAEIPDCDLSERAARAGLVVPALSRYFHNKPTLNGLVIGYAGTPLPQAKNAIATLARLL